jgi:cell division topological specificity factor
MNLINNVFNKLSHRFRKPHASAQCAKERLQIIIAHERVQRDQPDYLASLQRDLLEVISKYVTVNKEDIKVELDRQDGCSVLELNIVLPQMLMGVAKEPA